MTPRLRRTLLALAVIPVLFALAAGWHLLQQPRARRVGGMTVDRSEARIARGGYLVRHVAACFHCHSPIDASRMGHPPVPGHEGEGRVFADAGDGRIVAGNLTSAVEGGLGAWSDEEILRALREGVGKDRRALHPAMPYEVYRSLSDEDAQAIVAYLRSLPASPSDLPETRLKARIRFAIAGLPTPLASAVPPPPDDAIERGRYLATIARCVACHPRGADAPAPDIARASREAFIARFRALGKIPAGQEPAMSPELTSDMPWTAFGGMTEADLGEIHDYLRTVGSGPGGS